MENQTDNNEAHSAGETAREQDEVLELASRFPDILVIEKRVTGVARAK